MKTLRLAVLALLFASTSPSFAQQLWHPAQRIYAQTILDQIFKKHPELVTMGIHVTPPGNADNVIIASNVPEKIGKVSSSDDMDVMHGGKPLAKLKAANVYDIVLPLADRNGKTIGLVGMNVRYKSGSNEKSAVARAKKIIAELQRQIPSEAKLFEAAH